MKKNFLLFFLLLVSFTAAQSQVLINESFDATTFPPTGWTSAGTGTNAVSGPINWARVVSGGGSGPTPSTHSGLGMAYYNSYWIYSGGFAELRTPALNFSLTGTKILTFWLYNHPDYADDSLAVYINTSAVAGGTQIASLAPGYSASTTGWVQYTYTLPASYTTSSTYIIFKAKSDYYYDIFLDDVNVTNFAPCSGIPNVTAAGPGNICPNVPFTLSTTGATSSGLTFQWQSSPAGANTFANIAGATSATYSSTGITAATDYRVLVVCSSATGTDTSNVVSVALSNYANCYCTPTYTTGCAFSDDINTITLTGANSTSINQLNTGCTTGGYANYTSLTPVQLQQSTTYSGTMNSDYFSSEYVRIWIDFNNDGVFSNAEQVGTISNVGTTLTSYTISIPSAATATVGLHRMRYRLSYFTSPASSIDPCASYSYGETHDYNVIILGTPPAPAVTTNSPVCPGTTLTITATTPAASPSFTFTGPGIVTPVTNTTGILNIPNATTANNGVYSVTVTSFGFTSPAGTATATVYPTPTLTAGTITSPTACGGTNGSIQINGLTASTSYTLNYRKNNVPQTQASITSSASGSYVIANLGAASYDSIRVTTSNGCVSNVLGPLTVAAPSAPPTPAPTYNAPICNNSTLVLTVPNPTPGGTYTWTGPGGFSATGPTATRSNMTTAFGGNYIVTVTIAACVSAPGTVNVVVNPPDPAPVPNNTSYCQFETPSPVSAQGQNLRWYTSLTDTIGSTTAPVPSTATAGTQSFYVTQTITCESPKALVTITVKPKPLTPVATTNIVYCQFSQAVPLTAQGQNLLWFTTPTGGTGTAVAPTPVTVTPGTTTYYVAQNVNGCSSDRAAIVVTVIAKPAPPQVVSPLNVCQYDNVQLSAQGQNLHWYTTASGGVGVSVTPTVNTGYEDSFFYYVTQTVNGCESDRSQMHVIVNYKPNGIITASKNYVCQGDTISFRYFGNARPDAEYSWKTPQPQSQILSGTGTQGPLVVRYDSSGAQFVRLTVNNKGCLSPLITLPVTVRPLPQLSFTSKKDVCLEEVVNIALNGTIGHIATYNWFFDGGTVTYGSYDGGPYGVRFDEVGEHHVSVTAVANQCTSKPYIDTINVHELPDPTIIYTSSNNVCTGDTVTLKANYGDGNNYKWSPAGFFTPAANDGLNYVVQGLIYHTGYVRLDVTTKYGCMASDSTLFTTQPCCGVYFPNAFTPNGDGRNDYFRPITNGHHEVETFRITNRWGQVVYESKNERNGWNGMYNDKPQDMGTYYYYYHYRCSDGQYLDARGEFVLMR